MPCLIGCIALVAPRFLIVILAIFTRYLHDAYDTWIWPLLGALFYGFTFANPLGRWLTNRSLSRVRQPGMDLIEGFRTVRHVDNWRYLRVLVRSARNGVRVFAPYRGRVDIVYGQRTFAAVRRSLDDWCALWPDLVAVELGGVGHMPMHEAPRAVSDAVFRAASVPALGPGGGA